MTKEIYGFQVIVRTLSEEDGSGFLAEFPDVAGCYGDGDTPEEALNDAKSALDSWLETAKEFGDPLPKFK